MNIGCITNCLGKIELESFLERFQKAGVGIKYLEVSPETIGSYKLMLRSRPESILVRSTKRRVVRTMMTTEFPRIMRLLSKPARGHGS